LGLGEFEATYLFWAAPANNPISAMTSTRMVHVPECAAWTWDARPYPFFPELTDVWTDGPNWRLGHWLTGRLGAVSLAALVRHLCLRAGMPEERIDVSGLWGAVEGYVISALEAPRASISTLARHFGFDAVESEGRIRFLTFANAVTQVGMPQANLTAQLLGLGGATADSYNRLSINAPAMLFNNAGAGIKATFNKNAPANDAAFAFKTGFSARALIGLLGNDDFSFKVSPNGSTFFDAIRIDRNSGRVELPEPLHMPSLPAAPDPPPAGKLAVYARDRAGAGWLDVQRPSGRFFPLQPHFGVNRIATWAPSTSTTVNTNGMPRTAVGTVAKPTLATTNLSTSMRRWRVTSAATADAVAEERSAGWVCWRGNADGLGGWNYVNRLSLTTLQANGMGPESAWRWPSFSPAEIACRGTGAIKINTEAMDKLQSLSNRLGKPLIVRSAYRSHSHNRAVGGAPASKHMLGTAFDIAMSNHDPATFADAARAVGFLGFGFYPRSGFMHIDLGPAREWGQRFPVRVSAFAEEMPPAREVLAQSRTMQGGGAAGVATLGAAGVEVAQDVLAETQGAILPLVPYLDTLRWVLIAVALVGIAVTVYARLDDWKRGQR